MTDTSTEQIAAEIEAEARELHKKSCLDWMRWEQLGKPCKEEFRQDARRKFGIVEPPSLSEAT